MRYPSGEVPHWCFTRSPFPTTSLKFRMAILRMLHNSIKGTPPNFASSIKRIRILAAKFGDGT